LILKYFLNFLKSKYHHEHTAKCYLSYFERYAHVFFGLNPDVELFKLNPHKRSWILQEVKRSGDFIIENITIERSNSINKTNNWKI